MSAAPSRHSNRRWWVIGIVGVAIGIAIAVWFGTASTVGKPAYQVTGYHVVSSNETQVRYQVSRGHGRVVLCTVVALDVKHGTVGSVTARIPASSSTLRTVITSVRTTGRAVTGDVDSCAYEKQG